LDKNTTPGISFMNEGLLTIYRSICLSVIHYFFFYSLLFYLLFSVLSVILSVIQC